MLLRLRNASGKIFGHASSWATVAQRLGNQRVQNRERRSTAGSGAVLRRDLPIDPRHAGIRAVGQRLNITASQSANHAAKRCTCSASSAVLVHCSVAASHSMRGMQAWLKSCL